MSIKQVDITNRFWAEMAKVVSVVAKEGFLPVGGRAKPSKEILLTDLTLVAAGLVVNKYKIPISVNDEISIENGGRVIIREKEIY